MTVLEFVQHCLILAYKYQASVTSWGRTPDRNKLVGGHPNSRHMIWLGMDLVTDPMVKDEALEKDAEFLGLKAIFEDDHYHLEPK